MESSVLSCRFTGVRSALIAVVDLVGVQCSPEADTVAVSALSVQNFLHSGQQESTCNVTNSNTVQVCCTEYTSRV